MMTWPVLAAETPSGKTSFIDNCFAVLLVAVAAGFWFRSWIRSSEAADKATSLNPAEADASERRILEVLYRQPDLTLRVQDIAASLGEHRKFVLILVRRLVQLGHLSLVDEDDLVAGVRKAVGNFSDHSKVTLTALGDKRLKEKDPVVHHYGDYIHAGENARVTNRSVVMDSYNDFLVKYDSGTVVALKQLERTVRENGDPDGVEMLEGFLEEARLEKPSRARLRALFAGIQQAVPAVEGMVDTVLKVSQLFS